MAQQPQPQRKNIRVTKAADGQGLDVNLANNIELDNNGSIKIGDTTVNQDGITINNGPSVTKCDQRWY